MSQEPVKEMLKVQLKFMVDPDYLKCNTFIQDPVRCIVTDPEAVFLMGILGDSGREMVKAGFPFYFERPLAEKLITAGFAKEEASLKSQPDEKCPKCGRPYYDDEAGCDFNQTGICHHSPAPPIAQDTITPIKQTVFGKEKGNCLQTCIAMVLGLPLEEVPNFAESDMWLLDAQVFCLKHGVFLYRRPVYAGEEWYERIPETRTWIAEGETPRGLRHVVVMEGLTMVADPHPDNTGLTQYLAAWACYRIGHIQELAAHPTGQQEAALRDYTPEEALAEAVKRFGKPVRIEYHGFGNLNHGTLVAGSYVVKLNGKLYQGDSFKAAFSKTDYG